MQLQDFLENRRSAVVDRWAELALRVYPPDSARVMSREKDRFRNPVGRITRESLESLYDGVLAGPPSAKMRSALDDILRIRAVQDLSPSGAVEFLFLLKHAVREELGEEAAARLPPQELPALDSAVDRLALLAFDLFIRCREKIYELRIREIKRRATVLFERTGVAVDEQAKGGCGA